MSVRKGRMRYGWYTPQDVLNGAERRVEGRKLPCGSGSGLTPAPLAPISGTCTSATGAGRSVSVIDTQTKKVVRTVAVGVRPNDMAVGPDGRLFVACGGDNTVHVIQTRTLIDRAAIRTRPRRRTSRLWRSSQRPRTRSRRRARRPWAWRCRRTGRSSMSPTPTTTT